KTLIKMANKKSTVLLLLKLAFSLSILVFILTTQTSLGKIGGVLQNVNPYWLLLAFSLHALGLYISAYRWQILARAQGDEVPLVFLAKSYLVGTFFNNFLPTRFGGDVVRIWDGSLYSKSLVKSSAIVLVERFTGIIVLFLMAVVASLFRLDMARQVPVIWVALLLGLMGLLLIAAFFLPVFARRLGALRLHGFPEKVRNKILIFRETILHYRTQKGPFLRATLWALLLQLNVILYYFLIGRALHLEIQFIDYFIFIPIVLVIQIIPVTINGLGLREGSYIEIFKYYGILPQTAVSFSLVDVAFNLVLGAIGGTIYVSRKRRR
ncbi:MAG TPA: lysylphosphatidylglycerol synthase transmembrane domain-containing protein, partial [Candidatus Desulfaltia sp.]|nr:lysylphosphatidylglycerol synthase transmembrane domain-containing protein [Candidatus Desulfaltia sp.]